MERRCCSRVSPPWLGPRSRRRYNHGAAPTTESRTLVHTGHRRYERPLTFRSLLRRTFCLRSDNHGAEFVTLGGSNTDVMWWDLGTAHRDDARGNLSDLRRHADDFARGAGFTFTVL
jgi:hypothetical protein